MSYSKSFASALLAVAALGAGEADQAFVGTISDEICALSHSAMRMGPTDAECTRACIEEHGGAYILATDSRVYQLTDQQAARAVAGKRVKVVGTLDVATGTITVMSITGP